MFKIEKKIPIKRNKYKKGTLSGEIYQTLKKMELDDSFVMQKGDAVTFNIIKHDYEFKDKVFISRTETTDSVRVHRIK